MKPMKPSASDCCGSGCTPCVFDVYEAELKKWEKGESSGKNAELRNDLLSNLRYLPYKIITVQAIIPDVFLYRFQPYQFNEPEDCDSIVGYLNYKPSQHFIMRCPQKDSVSESPAENETRSSKVSVKNVPKNEEVFVTDQEITNMNNAKFISRAYTPITLACEEKNCCFDTIIKLYQHGAMSSILCDRNEGDLIYFRGPYGGFEHRPNSYSSLTMICAGTGLAPMISIIKSILKDENDETLISLLFTVSNFQSIILREEIRNFCRNWNVRAKIYLTREHNWDELCCSIRHDETIINHKINQEIINSEVLSQKDNQVLLCGPSSFCELVRNWLLLSSNNTITNQRIFTF